MGRYFVIIFLFGFQLLNAQVRYGIVGGINFPFVRSDFSNIRSLPVDKGGTNMLLGFKAAKNFGDNITLQTGLSTYKTGLTYSEYNGFYGVEFDQFNVSNVVSLPFNLFYNFIPKDEFGDLDLNFTASLGIGVYGSYLLSGKITDEDGNVTKATYGNMKRFDSGVSFIGKVTTFNHFDVIVSYHLGLSNLLKSGTGNLSFDALFMGVAYTF